MTYGDEEVSYVSQSSFSSDDEEEGNVSIANLLSTEEEMLNFRMMNHSIYSDEVLFKIGMAPLLADTEHTLSIRAFLVLIKVRTQFSALDLEPRPFMVFLEILISYAYLRLNSK